MEALELSEIQRAPPGSNMDCGEQTYCGLRQVERTVERLLRPLLGRIFGVTIAGDKPSSHCKRGPATNGDRHLHRERDHLDGSAALIVPPLFQSPDGRS
jgi:hypothetical protein